MDWFHIAMRIEQLLQTARGMGDEEEQSVTKAQILAELGRIKWFLWHGNVMRANDTLTAEEKTRNGIISTLSRCS